LEVCWEPQGEIKSLFGWIFVFLHCLALAHPDAKAAAVLVDENWVCFAKKMARKFTGCSTTGL
jgi:hypothetical protein